MDETSKDSKNHTAAVGLIILGIIVLLPGACGFFFLGEYLYYWTTNAFDLSTSNYSFKTDEIHISLASFFGSISLLGVLMRLANGGRRPPSASALPL